MWSLFFISHGIFFVLYFIDCDQKDIVVERSLNVHFFNGFIENIQDLYWLSPVSLGGFSETSNLLAVFLKLCGGLRARVWPKWLKARFQKMGSTGRCFHNIGRKKDDI